MNRKSVIENRSSKIWHLTDCNDCAEAGAILDSRCPMPDFKIPTLQRNSKSQVPMRRHRAGNWNLELGIFLELGVWDLVFGSTAREAALV
jgi:hypothetical protein